MAMKAVIPNGDKDPPCVVYWTGRQKLHVHVVTWCSKERADAASGILQVPAGVRCCAACETAIAELNYPRLH